MLKAATLDIDRRRESSVRGLGVGGNVKLLNKKIHCSKRKMWSLDKNEIWTVFTLEKSKIYVHRKKKPIQKYS